MRRLPDEGARLPQRRTSLRAVAPDERILAQPPAIVVRAGTPGQEGPLEMLRKLWRRRHMIIACTVLLGAIGTAVAWSMPSYYVSEAHVLVGVPAPRVLNAEAIIANVNPDAERVVSEAFILQSRNLAKTVIDRLHLAEDPEFNLELRQPSRWSHLLDVIRLPAGVKEWIARPRSPAPEPSPPDAATARDNRIIDALLSRVDVSPLGRSHVLSVKAESQNPAMSSAIANTLAEVYLDYQQHEKVAARDRVDKFLLGRITQLREQVRKSDEVVEDYRRKHGIHRSSNATGVSVQQRSELNAKAEARAANARYEALEREATVNRNLLEAMLSRAKQSTSAEDILQADAKLVSPAAPAQAPSYPPKPLIAFLGGIGGLLFGSALALLRESGDRTFRRADQIEAMTGLPVLAMVPQVSTRTPPPMQVLRHPTSAYTEALRRVQIGIELSEAAASPKTILLSSATPSEGKSVMTASLGRLLASNGKRVLLIDCDWRSPKLHQIFHCNNKEGLAGLLAEKTEVVLDDIIHHDALSGADVLTSGSWSPRSAHLLSSPRMRHLLDALTPHYDFVILDTAPALMTADVLALARIVEKVVFVVRWGHTRQDAALEALKQIIDAQGDVAGMVFSRVVSRQYRQYGYRDPFYEYSRPTRASFSSGRA